MSPLLYMDAEIRPNRSLSERGFIILITVVTVANCASAAVFLAVGATFVPFFLGVDLIAVVVAFLVSFRAAKRIERGQVTASEIRVTHETPRWSKLVWESPTAFTRLHVEKEEERTVALKLALSGREAEPPRTRRFRPGAGARDLAGETGADLTSCPPRSGEGEGLQNEPRKV